MRMSMLGTSAKKIQSAWRVYLMRSLFVMIRQRAIMIQAMWRRYFAKLHVWNMMKPAQRRRSLLFRAYLEKSLGCPGKARPRRGKSQSNRHDDDRAREGSAPGAVAAPLTGETDSEEERELQAERERLERLKATREEQERQRREEEQHLLRIRLEEEAAERRRQEELQRLEQAKQQAAEEERQRAEELRLATEKAFEEEKAQLVLQHNEELRQLRKQVAASQDEQEVARTEHQGELLRMMLGLGVGKRESMMSPHRSSEEGRTGDPREECGRAGQAARDAEQHTERANPSLGGGADEQDTLKSQEQEQNQRFQDELQQLREREAQQRQKHEEQMKEMRAREEERQRKIQEDLGEESYVDLVQGRFGPFRAHVPMKLPLWAALEMEEHQMCSIELPPWMEEDQLKALCTEEKANRNGFTPLPRHYMEIAFALLPLPKVFGGKEKYRQRIVLLLRELIDAGTCSCVVLCSIRCRKNSTGKKNRLRFRSCALRDSNKADLEKRLLEEQVNDSKAEMDQTRSMLEIQQEERDKSETFRFENMWSGRDGS
eukprot:g30981.t1